MQAKPRGRAKLVGDRLTITVNRLKGQHTEQYRVIRLNPHPAVAFEGIRLRKDDGSSFDVHRDGYGLSCECQDFQGRRQRVGDRCKHLLALVAVGLMEDA